MSKKFPVQQTDQLKRLRPSHKELTDVAELGITNYLTIDGLAQKHLITKLKVIAYLREAEVWPVGKVYKIDPATGKRSKGQPALAYDPDSAGQAITAALTPQL